MLQHISQTTNRACKQRIMNTLQALSRLVKGSVSLSILPNVRHMIVCSICCSSVSAVGSVSVRVNISSAKHPSVKCPSIIFLTLEDRKGVTRPKAEGAKFKAYYYPDIHILTTASLSSNLSIYLLTSLYTPVCYIYHPVVVLVLIRERSIII